MGLIEVVHAVDQAARRTFGNRWAVEVHQIWQCEAERQRNRHYVVLASVHSISKREVVVVATVAFVNFVVANTDENVFV